MREGDGRMKSFNPSVIIPCVLLGVFVGFIASEFLHGEAENKVKTPIECIADGGTNVFGEHYAIAGVVDENGRCVELLDTAPKVTKSKTVESITNEDGYTIRIEDLDGDGRVDIYNQIDNKTGQKVLNIFKDFETGNVYSECTLPGRAILGEGPSLEDRGILDSYNDMLVLKNPEKHGYKVISRHDAQCDTALTQKVTKAELESGDYTIRILDMDGDGRVDKYDKADKAGNIVLRIFRDLKTGKVYSIRSECTTPERFIDGLIANLEDSTVLDTYNDILKNPRKHDYRSVSKPK